MKAKMGVLSSTGGYKLSTGMMDKSKRLGSRFSSGLSNKGLVARAHSQLPRIDRH